MTFIIVLLSLFAERYLLELDDYRQPSWFNRYLSWSQQLPWGEWMSQSVSGILIILAPLLIAVGLLHGIFEDILGGIPELLYASAVLLFCLGPRDLQRQVQGFIDTLDAGDDENAQHIKSELVADNPGKEETTHGHEIAIGILEQAYLRTFSVLFWFVLLGPIGAVLYRASHTLQQSLPELEELGLDFRSGVNRLLYILDWVPVRITAFTYALSGNFHDATYTWWSSNEDQGDSADSIIGKAGSGALGLDNVTGEDDDPVIGAEMALALTLRSLTIWVGLLALITITSWLS